MILLATFHVSVIALNSFTLWYDQMYVDIPFPSKDIAELPFKARQMFLTVWCLVLQTLYFSVSLLNDVSGTDATAPKNPPLIRRAKDITFSLAFPVAIYVSLVFWSLYFTNKDLIFPDEVQKQFPWWLNSVMHTLIVPFICIEMLVTKRIYPSRKFGINVMIAFISTYSLWVLAIYIHTGIWAYPFLEFLNWPLRIIFFVVSTLGALGMYVVGEKLNRAINPRAKVYTNGVNGNKH